MKLKSILGGAIALSLVSFGSYANGQGVVNFKGSVINAPCGIAPESIDQSIDFGQISKAHLNAGGTSVKKNLDIKLVNCDLTATNALTKGVKVNFSGTTLAGDTKTLGTAGDATGTGIVIYSQDGTQVDFVADSAPQAIKPGDNTLHYNTWVVAPGKAAKEGAFTAVAHFNLAYE
ncbi:fimbrial protein [Citrobacter braakii]|uniref:fimbrial protein n=1 Tax=Citrobacter braakii TaxID=57706 RepID=UPI003C2F2541|nr:type 1 fimbrial protein [Citrobacter freundii]